MSDASAWLDEERVEAVMRNERAVGVARYAQKHAREVDANKRKRYLEREARRAMTTQRVARAGGVGLTAAEAEAVARREAWRGDATAGGLPLADVMEAEDVVFGPLGTRICARKRDPTFVN